jgi:hypothetical protein
MKNTHLQNLALLGLISALLVLPVNAMAAEIAFSVTGLLAILFADYGRNMEPLKDPARSIPFSAPALPEPELRDAA